RRAIELWAKAPALDPDSRLERSRALALLAGLGGDAKSGVTTTEATAFADQAVADLRDAIKAGLGRGDELKEPEFDALRGRDDFQTVLAELDAAIADNLGFSLSQTGKPDEATEAFLKALGIRQRLSDAHPTNLSYRLAVAGAHRKLGTFLYFAGKPDT